jgi:hypothetical protein
LKPTGASNGGCSSNTGQIYVRGTTYGNYYALMYSCKSKIQAFGTDKTDSSRVHAQRRALYWTRPQARLGRSRRLALQLYQRLRLQYPSRLPISTWRLGLLYQWLLAFWHRSIDQIRECLASGSLNDAHYHCWRSTATDWLGVTSNCCPDSP